MEYTVYCPVCQAPNEIVDLFEKGTEFDWECEECGVLFAVEVEYEPRLYGNKIKWELCECCLELVREVIPADTFVNTPEQLKGKEICKTCIRKELGYK
jgi:hypothetical protein